MNLGLLVRVTALGLGLNCSHTPVPPRNIPAPSEATAECIPAKLELGQMLEDHGWVFLGVRNSMDKSKTDRQLRQEYLDTEKYLDVIILPTEDRCGKEYFRTKVIYGYEKYPEEEYGDKSPKKEYDGSM